MKQSRRSFFSVIAGALLIGASALRAQAAERYALLDRRIMASQRYALVSHSLGWEDGLTGRPARGQFKSIADARKAGWSDDLIIVPPSHIEPSGGAHDFPR